MSIKSARLAAGYTQEDVARILKVSISAVCRWETGRTLPTAAKLIPLSRLYKVDVEELLKQDEE